MYAYTTRVVLFYRDDSDLSAGLSPEALASLRLHQTPGRVYQPLVLMSCDVEGVENDYAIGAGP